MTTKASKKTKKTPAPPPARLITKGAYCNTCNAVLWKPTYAAFVKPYDQSERPGDDRGFDDDWNANRHHTDAECIATLAAKLKDVEQRLRTIEDWKSRG
ncbi:MAG: hypothetical protein ACHREM_00615 [Polyangiales bacterium]